MGFFLTEPAVAGIKTYMNGLKIIRLHEYAGSGRSTIAVVTDPLSPAGKAVKDTQELSPATTGTGRASSVDNTASIPVAQLSIGADASYVGYLGIRVVGRPPVGARANEVWNSQSLVPGPAVARLDDTTLYSYFAIPREFYRGYTFVRVGDFDGAALSGISDLNFRAWGITGGSMEFYLDLLYLVPFVLASTDLGEDVTAGSFDPLDLLTSSGGDLGPDEDNNTNNSIATAHSVMPSVSIESVWSGSVSLDIQDAEYEKTVVDWNSIFFSDPNHTKSWVTAVVGSRNLNAHQIETEDFSAYTGTTPGTAPGLRDGETTQGYVLHGGESTMTGNVTNYPPVIAYSAGWYLFNTSLKFIGRSSGAPLGFKTYAPWDVGALTVRPVPVSGAGSSDPRNVAPLLLGYDSFIYTYKVNFLMANAGGAVEMHFGGGRWSAVDTAHQTRITNTAKVIHNTNGTHQFAFEAWCTNAVTENSVDFDGPVTVMGALSPGDSYWVKVEKRFNLWRARCWVDGDPEPSTWDIEGFAPAWVDSVSLGGNVKPVSHPYNVNWPTDATRIYEDPRYWQGTHSVSFSATRWLPEGRMHTLTGFSTLNYSIEIAEFTFEYDPDPDDEGDPTGAYYHFEKYDGSEDWGTVYVPPGAWRMLISDYADHHFASDTHGGNMYAWKEDGSEPLQSAGWSDLYFRRPAKVPQWGELKYP